MPFYHEPSKQFYMDDPLSDNIITAVAFEWRAIWPDLAQEYPDILLSIGTGCNLSPHSPAGHITRKRTPSWMDAISPGKLGLKSSKECFLINRQNAWDAYTTQLPDFALERFFRLNPELSEDLPAADDIDRMIPLQRMMLEHAQIQTHIRRLASHLVASLFYFELSEQISEA
jgi:hypothetical protein